MNENFASIASRNALNAHSKTTHYRERAKKCVRRLYFSFVAIYFGSLMKTIQTHRHRRYCEIKTLRDAILNTISPRPSNTVYFNDIVHTSSLYLYLFRTLTQAKAFRRVRYVMPCAFAYFYSPKNQKISRISPSKLQKGKSYAK